METQKISFRKGTTQKQQITFIKTSDPLTSAGIIGVYKYCEKRKKERKDLDFRIDRNSLVVEADNLEKVLSEMYYEMGQEYYDTSTQKQIEKNEGFYYDEASDRFIRFPKVKTTGLANLIHDAQPIPLDYAEKLEKIRKEDPTLAKKIEEFCKTNKLKPGKKIWFNNRNTAIPKLEKMELGQGKGRCIICGESFKKTFESKSSSPFIGGSNADKNFVSFLKGGEKICWKCLYLQRFSPVVAFFHNDFSTNTLHIFLFNSNSIDGMKKINVDLLKSIFYPKLQLVACNYSHNFDIYKFEKKEVQDYFTHSSELLLMLLYTIYKKVEKVKQSEDTELDELFPIEEIEEELFYNTEVFFFQTKKFAQTTRPTRAEKFSEIYYLFKLFEKVDLQLNLQHLLWELKLAKNDKNKNLGRTLLRNNWAEQVLKRKPTISTIEEIAFFKFVSKDYKGNFDNLIRWLKLYESLINYGGNKMMNDEMRDIAINLGKQIVGGMEEKVKKSGKELKQERGKLISLRKARTLSKFLEQIVGLQIRYDLTINKEILEKIDEKNFDYFRQFAIISALNSFNWKISKKKQNGGNNE